ncbi:PD-(D/E)XK nuclease family protein [Psychroserpens ponticola]|uniref:PD-(D/E)XK nuclease family protein n=1 Tax=Psychroserpens ponticola TaxID=2932268 RepID=A0ABY7RYJ2_9FLAO|nr:PD-(D/E)XK nuclease family protein [Psychroserpens ponticola]WCO01802.1 PD-(D/E)XK nuclease family protein [Psychroserpens ponticola]
MVSFLNDVIVDLQKKNADFSQLTFVLPSKRAGVFLKNQISNHLNKTIFAPKILSIEEFIETLSDLKYANNTELLFEFYKVYLSHTPKDQIEPFDTFSKWAQMLLQDFNEIDRYLVSPNHIFDYLNAIKEIEHQHWSLEENQTPYVKNYLSFWNRLKLFYTEFSNQLIKNKKGYQGLVYKEAIENLEQFIDTQDNETYVFIGFNALNKAEEIIIQELLQQNIASIYWDIDASFVKDQIHDAGLFIRAHKSQWHYFNNEDFNWLSNYYNSEKKINCIGAPKNIGQIKYVGELLSDLKQQNATLENTAIVLGDESLLIPLLNSIPKNIGPINITMGLPLSSIPMASLFESLFRLHKSSTTKFYHKDVITILSNQFIKPLFNTENDNISDYINSEIQQNNISYLTIDHLKTLAGTKSEIIKLLFETWQNNSKIALEQCAKLILELKNVLDQNKQNNLLALEYLYRFNVVFNELNTLNNTYSYINNISVLFGLYKEILKNETLDFKGEPLKGLQIMGMLESRVLDFETVILTSVNEGILPAGKSNSSFIPFDVKLENSMPTYKEKDAVYTYHFYRLLQRAKDIHIIYNTEPDVLNGGEKSRFITQLEIDKTHNIKHNLVSPKVPITECNLIEISKSSEIIDELKRYSKSGFSPSALTNYIRNPLAFYYEKILGIKQYEDVEESVALNTLGTIIHNTLEDFYKPIEGQILTLEIISEMVSKIDDTVSHHFKTEYKQGDITKGKNLIIYKIAKHYILNFLKLESKDIKEGNTIKILAIETKNEVPIDIDGLEFPIILTGKVDRVDIYNGITRIIDYKSGRVEQNKVEIVNWEDISSDYDKYSKSFQILMYAYMMYKQKKIVLPVEAGIISFKKLSSGFIKFGKKASKGTRTKDNIITEETLIAFEIELKKLISEICDPNINFIEKDV